MKVNEKTFTLPVEREFEDAEAAYTEFTWRMEKIEYLDLFDIADVEYRAARGFVVEDEIWFDPQPIADHRDWWDNILKEEYNREWESKNPNQILYFKVAQPGQFLIPFPKVNDATKEGILRMCYLLKELNVPRDVDVYWSITGAASDKQKAGEYYDIIN